MLKRFDASLEWLMERIGLREQDMDNIRIDDHMEDFDKNQLICSKRMKTIAEVLELVEVLLDTHFFDEFYETKSSGFLKHVLANQAAIDIWLFKKTWRTLDCTPKPMKVIREVQENLLCIGKMKEMITKKRMRRSVGAAKQGWLSIPSASSAAAR